MIQRASKSDASGETPMMKQYFRAKADHPGDVVFFRMGDFYEMFYDDAEKASEILGITLTSRSKDKSGVRIPMAGVPVKSLDAHVRRLLAAGERVAICEQLEDATDAKGIVERGVVRVVTPGTFIDEDQLDDAKALHLAAVSCRDGRVGIAWCDLSTGSFFAEDVPADGDWRGVLLRIAPKECVFAEGAPAGSLPPVDWIEAHIPNCARTPYPEWHFDEDSGRERLLAHFGTRTLEGFGCENLSLSIGAAGAVLRYLDDTQKQALPHITRIARGSSQRYLGLDAATYRSLDLTEVARTGERRGSLLHLVDRSKTAMGARRIRDWLGAPLVDLDRILERQNAVTTLVEDATLRDEIREALGRIRDIERLSSKLPYGRVNGRDLRALEQSLAGLPDVVRALERTESRALERVREVLERPVFAEIASKIDARIDPEPPVTVQEGGVIRDGWSEELDEIRRIGAEGVDWIAKFQKSEAERTGIPNLKVGYNRVFGYYIEVTTAHREKVPDNYVRKQTLKNAERYINDSLKEQESRVVGARERANRLEQELFQALRADIADSLADLQECAYSVAILDALQSLATLATSEGYVRPEMVETPVLDVVGGRHPVLSAGAGRADFTPNDTGLGGEKPTLAVITGPNMAGKSTYIRQSALIVILAQMGSYVPADSATIGVADRLFTRVGAADDLSSGQSTFMVEMTETANILNNATERSLVILDEVGRGTSTLDGLSIAWAIAEYLADRTKCRALFATHYHELTDLESRLDGRVRNLNVSVREWRDEIVFLHKIVEGGTDRSYGIHVARLAGIPGAVIDRSKDVLAALEGTSERRTDIPDSPAEKPDRAATPGGAAGGDASSGRQLDLFAAPGEEIVRRIRAIDPLQTTPMEALALLAELRDKIEG